MKPPNMKRIIVFALTISLVLCLAACKNKADVGKDAFAVNVICKSDGVYRIFYSCYFDDEYYGMGGMADYDGNELSPDTELKLVFSKSYFDGLEDVSDFSIDFSPYGKDDTSEIGTTNRVYINAEYGESYFIVFSGDEKEGFSAEFAEDTMQAFQNS